MRISIEGNIGSGKSSLLDALPKRSPWLREHVDFFPEPLHEWGDTLQRYLQDKKTWSVPLTLDILRGFGNPAAQTTKRHQIVERNPYTCRHVFTQILLQDGDIKQNHMHTIDEYMSIFGWKPDMIVYLNVPPATCLDRIEARARDGEASITYEELKLIEYMHEKMFRDQLSDTTVISCTQGETESIDAFHARISILLTKTLNENDQKNGLENNQRC